MHELPIAWIRHAAQQLGADSPVLRGALTAAGLSPAVLTAETALVSTHKCIDFLEEAARLSGDGTLGLKLGKSYDLRTSGLSAYVSISADTLRQGLLNAIRYGTLIDTSADYALEERGNVVTVRIDSQSAYFRSIAKAPSSRWPLSWRPVATGRQNDSGCWRSGSHIRGPLRSTRSQSTSAARSCFRTRPPSFCSILPCSRCRCGAPIRTCSRS